MESVSIIVNTDKDEKLEHTMRYLKILLKCGYVVWIQDIFKGKITNCLNESLDLESYNNFVKFSSKREIIKNSDLVLIIGGDGTILSHFKSILKFEKPILGINHGTLGFISQVEKKEENVLNEFFLGNFEIDERLVLEARIRKNFLKNEKKTENLIEENNNFYAMNEFVISRSGFSKIININLFINKKYAFIYLADAIIVSTPTGSTAYSLSAGGPILHPNTKSVVITPICSHTLTNRSLVIPDEKIIQVFATCEKKGKIELIVDGKKSKRIVNDCYLEIKKSKYKVKLVKLKSANFFEIFKRKFSNR